MKTGYRICAVCLIYLVLWQIHPLNAQIKDDFSDGNHTGSPVWLGDQSHFIVNAALELQLNAPAAGVSTLYLPVSIADSNVWEMYLRMDFDPSNSNRLRVYLQCNSENFNTGKGYFLQIGKDGNTDALEFFRQDGATSVLLATGSIGAVAFSPKPRLRITRETGGIWTLSVDYTGGNTLKKEFTIKDDTYFGGNQFFGLQCTYSSTRRDKFFFDDILIAPLLPDKNPPVLVSAIPISEIELDVYFNEPLDELTATDPSNYQINNHGSPSGSFLDNTNKSLVHLVFSKPFASLTNYMLTTSGIKDLSGNSSNSQNTGFQYIKKETAEEFDILINEIMADPTPQVGLPNFEFIELFNRSNKVIDLAGFGFSNGGTPQLLPGYLLLPNKYVLVCAIANEEAMKKFGAVVPLTSFPTLANDGDDLALNGPGGKVIHFVNYFLSWYGDSKKADGGWTLEMINPMRPCGESENWTASKNLIGGTPGQPNSVLNSQPDTKSPELIRVSVSQEKPYELLLYFSEGLDRISAENPSNYSIDKGIGVFSASLLPLTRSTVRLILNNSLQPNIVYNLIVGKQVKDCSANIFGTNDKLTFALPVPIEPKDIVINEILFNPVSGGSDFLELYNRSKKVMDLSQIIIANLSAGSGNPVPVTTSRLFYPGEYIVFTPSLADIISRYPPVHAQLLIGLNLPSFPDDKGNVTLYTSGSLGPTIIDSFNYDRKMHHPLLDDENGVSLERLNPDAPTQSPSNWHSAAASAGFATPGFRNSQSFESIERSENLFDIQVPKLSPNGDGFQDYLIINFWPDKPGYLATIKIFDADGRPVKSLLNNELLPSEGFFRWDGDTDSGTKARIGIYILLARLFHPDGTTHEFKKAVVIAGSL